MPSSCCVPKCKGNYDTGPKVSVFSFPKDEDLKKQWITAIGRDNFTPTKGSRVCEIHFEDEDIEREVSVFDRDNNRTLTCKLDHPRVRKGAIPKIFSNFPIYTAYEFKAKEASKSKKPKIEENNYKLNKQDSEDNENKMDFQSLEELEPKLHFLDAESYSSQSPSTNFNTRSNVSSAERWVLLGVMASSLRTLDSKDNDTKTVHQKAILWEQVAKQFNSRSAIPRSRHQIQTLYKNMKAKAKKYQSRIREAQMENLFCPEKDQLSEVLLQLLTGENEKYRMQVEQTARLASDELSAIAASIGINHLENADDDAAKKDTNLPHDPNQVMEMRFQENSDSCLSIKNEPLENCDVDPLVLSPERANSDAEDIPRISHENTSHCPIQPRISSKLFSAIQIDKSTEKCCCPQLHSQLLLMAKREHEFKMYLLSDQKQNQLDEHKMRMELLSLEKELLQEKFSRVKTLTTTLPSNCKVESDKESNNLESCNDEL